ncbi:YqhA family protein [Curtanaerobium respiraculi]|uniref:YqhA family protein n=1 Tax=Curtanaerobium respiraculi TaxID=2949669 RepID=UPI0024B3B2A0|nr:YqhA family protein [Curtanaerobium respiraculi]
MDDMNPKKPNQSSPAPRGDKASFAQAALEAEVAEAIPSANPDLLESASQAYVETMTARVEEAARAAANDHAERLKMRRESNERVASRLRMITGWTRAIAAIPALGLFFASLAISINALVAVISTTLTFATGSAVYSATEGADVHSLLNLAIEYVEYTDMFLLAVALYIMALGLVCLFISDKIPLPGWLGFHDFDDLKERLVSVICVMMGVYFLGQVLQGSTGTDLLMLAAGIGIVIISLTLFVRHVIMH